MCRRVDVRSRVSLVHEASHFVRYSEVSLRTGLAPVSDRITRGRNAIFGYVARLSVNTPAHQAMLRQVELSVGRPPDPTRKRPPGRPRTKWTDQPIARLGVAWPGVLEC